MPRHVFYILSFVVVGLFLVRDGRQAVTAGDSQKEELEAVRKKRAELERQLKSVQEREGVLERSVEARGNGYYARVEVKGKLGKKVIPPSGPFQPEEVVEWTITAGENSYELFFDNSPLKATFVKLAEGRVGKSVLVTGELAAPRHPKPQLLEVRTFTAPKE